MTISEPARVVGVLVVLVTVTEMGVGVPTIPESAPEIVSERSPGTDAVAANTGWTPSSIGTDKANGIRPRAVRAQVRERGSDMVAGSLRFPNGAVVASSSRQAGGNRRWSARLRDLGRCSLLWVLPLMFGDM